MMHKHNKFILSITVFFVGLIWFTPSGVLNAQGVDVESQISVLEAQISAKLSEIEALKSQLSSLREETKNLKKDARELRSQLREGAHGEEVALLQEWLAGLEDIYPEGLVTGYYGPLTKKAVMKFQKKYGIDQVGEVGPRTRGQLHAVFTFFGSVEKTKNKSKKNDEEEGGEDDEDVDDDDSSISGNGKGKGKGRGKDKITLCHKPGTSAMHAITVAIPAMPAHILHGDTVGACGGGDDDDDTGSTTPDTIAPVISNLVSTSTTANTTNIEWNTNEDATSKVLYSTSTPLSSAPFFEMFASTTLTSLHEVFLEGLMASTTYYYKAVSSDVAANTATSSEQSFITLE